MRLTVIIPTFNEARYIARLTRHLFEHAVEKSLEILVVDGGSTDGTARMAQEAGARVLSAPKKSRAVQMNYGASLASGEVFYFVHADTLPPPGYFDDISRNVAEGYQLGRYRTRFDSNNWLLKLNAFFTRFDWFVCYGGDQTLFITRELFTSIGEFREDLEIMEEYELVARAREKTRYKIMPGEALVSARKYERNSWWQVQQANYRIVQMYKNGASQEALVQRYKELLRF